MGKYELIMGEENGVGDPKKNLLSIKDGYTIREIKTGKPVAIAVDINSPKKSPRPQAKLQRLVSLDVFRGLTVAVRFLDLFPFPRNDSCFFFL